MATAELWEDNGALSVVLPYGQQTTPQKLREQVLALEKEAERHFGKLVVRTHEFSPDMNSCKHIFTPVESQ